MFMDYVASASRWQASKSPTLPIRADPDDEHASQPHADADDTDEEDNFDDEKDDEKVNDGDVWAWTLEGKSAWREQTSIIILHQTVFTNVSFVFFLNFFFGDGKTSFVTLTELVLATLF